MLCEHLAYDIDAAARIVTVVHIGSLHDDDVLRFYTQLIAGTPAVSAYDYLLDMRYTDWVAAPTLVVAICDLLDHGSGDAMTDRRFAVVRKDPAVAEKMQEGLLRDGLKHAVIRHFNGMPAARAWLAER